MVSEKMSDTMQLCATGPLRVHERAKEPEEGRGPTGCEVWERSGESSEVIEGGWGMGPLAPYTPAAASLTL